MKLKHWSLVLAGGSGTVDLLDANDLGGWRKHEVRDFNEVRKNYLKMICEVANLGNDKLVCRVRTMAAVEKISTREDGCFCRTWVIGVLKSLKKNNVELYGDPEMIQKAVQHVVGEMEMQYGPEYYVVAPDRAEAQG
ncbi:hypothetical protein GQX73_g4354 [Xylaria multiplex]|uniref:Uncharacterized protein n=1 Tax=Xylaria multiplex TaxID=323545 RepID=A0A7C8MVA7_9PEZI|nr:hypothetical protein GQX73_g4354 [Xylaria multiplex]